MYKLFFTNYFRRTSLQYCHPFLSIHLIFESALCPQKYCRFSAGRPWMALVRVISRNSDSPSLFKKKILSILNYPENTPLAHHLVNTGSSFETFRILTQTALLVKTHLVIIPNLFHEFGMLSYYLKWFELFSLTQKSFNQMFICQVKVKLFMRKGLNFKTHMSLNIKEC